MDTEVHAMTPAERMTNDLCPECGKDLAHTNVLGHRDYHYPRQQVTRGLQAEAKVRHKMLTEYAASQAAKPADEPKPS
jgi:hypothetical protein